jgi:hypothetical protein
MAASMSKAATTNLPSGPFSGKLGADGFSMKDWAR